MHWFDDIARGYRSARRRIRKAMRRPEPPDRGESEIGIVDIHAASKTHE